MPTDHAEIVHNLRLRMPDCGINLCSHFADQLLVTGTKTTAKDAFAAFCRWLEAEGGRPDQPLTFEADAVGPYHRAAIVICEVARYI